MPWWKRVAMAGSRILVVDDDDDIRGLLRALLERAGHEVTDAPDGRAGLRALYAGSPDLSSSTSRCPASTAGRRWSGSGRSLTSRS